MTLEYIPALDGLRGVCVLLVIGHHMSLPGMSAGFLGVDGFFVLSGYLITSLLMQEWQKNGRIGLGAFYARRALRLAPALIFFLLVCAIYTWLVFEGDTAQANWHGILFSSLYLSNWANVILGDSYIGLGIMLHTWSLAVEEQFYVLWPVLLLTFLSLRFNAGQILGVLALRVWLFTNGAEAERLALGFDTRADSLLIGCILGLLMSLGIVQGYTSSYTTYASPGCS